MIESLSGTTDLVSNPYIKHSIFVNSGEYYNCLAFALGVEPSDEPVNIRYRNYEDYSVNPEKYSVTEYNRLRRAKLDKLIADHGHTRIIDFSETYNPVEGDIVLMATFMKPLSYQGYVSKYAHLTIYCRGEWVSKRGFSNQIDYHQSLENLSKDYDGALPTTIYRKP